MKELELYPQIKKERKIPVRKEVKLIGSENLIKGLSLWSKNLKTGEVNKVVIDEIEYNNLFDKNSSKRLKVNFDPDCIYVQALNKRNAIKKFNKK